MDIGAGALEKFLHPRAALGDATSQETEFLLALDRLGKRVELNQPAHRLVLEVAAARLAGRRSYAGPAALELVQATVESLERWVDGQSFPTRVDVAFHRAVVQSAANPYLADLLAPLWQALAATVAPALASQWTREHTVRMAAEHRAVLEALRVGDGELAAFAMERHLRSELARLGDRVSVEGPPPRFFA